MCAVKCTFTFKALLSRWINTYLDTLDLVDNLPLSLAHHPAPTKSPPTALGPPQAKRHPVTADLGKRYEAEGSSSATLT